MRARTFFTPLRQGLHRRTRAEQVLTVATAAAFGLAVTFALFSLGRRAECRYFQSQFQRNAEACTHLVEDRIQDAGRLMIASVARFVEHSDEAPSAEDFTTFVAPLSAACPEVRAVVWVPAVPDGKLSEFERNSTQELAAGSGMFYERLPQGGIRHTSSRPMHYPALLIVPRASKEHLIGYDLGSEQIRLAAMEKARDTGEPTVTAPIPLLESKPTSGALLFIPVYRNGVSLRTLEERRRALRGFAMGVFDARGVLDATIGSLPPIGVESRLFDLSSDNTNRLLGYRPSKLRQQISWLFYLSPNPPSFIDEFKFGGRRWALQIDAVPGYVELNYKPYYWLILPAGILADLLLCLYLYSILNQRRALEEAVAEQTASLRESESLFRSMFDVHDAMMWLVDPASGDILRANAACEAFYGFSPGTLATMNVGEINIASPDEVAEMRRRAAERGSSHFIMQHRLASGEVHDIEVHSCPISYLGKSVLFSIMSDISERRSAEQALRLSEKRFRDLIQQAPEAILLHDPTNDTFLEANPAAETLLGCRREEILQRGILDFYDPAQSDGVPIPESMQRNARRVLNGEQLTIERDLLIGEVRKTCEVHLAPIEYAGRTCVRISLMDISARKKVEALRDLLMRATETTSDPVLITDSEAQILYCNPAFCALTGLTPEEARGRTFREGHPPEFYAEVWQSLSAGKPWAGSLRVRRKDGNIFEGRGSIAPMRDAKGRIGNFVAVIKDTTGESILREQLVRSQRMEAIGRLAGGIAHDFNNLLMVITGYADLMLQEAAPGTELDECLRAILSATDRGAGLTRQMLAFSRQQIVTPSVLDLHAVVQECSAMFRRLIGEHIRFHVVETEKLWPVEADSSQISQILMNLCTNARDAMPQGGVITLTTSNLRVPEGGAPFAPSAPAGDYVLISARDTGCGMSAEVLEHVFEPFFTTKEVGKGTGLGLSTVYGIVQQNNGFVAAESTPGEGSTFHIALPRTPKPLRIAVQTDAPHPAPTPGGTILLVEDEERVREPITKFLRTIGYEVLPAESGPAALELAESYQGKLNVLLTDIVMPGMNGRELADRLQKKYGTMQTIFMSGFTDDELTRHGVREWKTAFLQKPFKLSTLRDRLAEAFAEISAHP